MTLKRMVFTNIETGELYHGMGVRFTMVFTWAPTKIEDLEYFKV